MAKLYVVGFGPGGKEDMTFRAAQAIEAAPSGHGIYHLY